MPWQRGARYHRQVKNGTGTANDAPCSVIPRSLPLLLMFTAPLQGAPAGVAGGATRAALTQHFAVRGNAADVAAKEGSQVGPLQSLLLRVTGMALNCYCHLWTGPQEAV